MLPETNMGVQDSGVQILVAPNCIGVKRVNAIKEATIVKEIVRSKRLDLTEVVSDLPPFSRRCVSSFDPPMLPYVPDKFMVPEKNEKENDLPTVRASSSKEQQRCIDQEMSVAGESCGMGKRSCR